MLREHILVELILPLRGGLDVIGIARAVLHVMQQGAESRPECPHGVGASSDRSVSARCTRLSVNGDFAVASDVKRAIWPLISGLIARRALQRHTFRQASTVTS